MRNKRWLVLPLLLFFLLSCGLFSGVQNITNTVSTQLPGILTGVPTEMGAIETVAAQQTPLNCGTPTTGGLGITLDKTKTVLEATKQFTFVDGTENGQPVSTATLASGGASTYSSIANGFSAKFYGDPCNLNRVLVTVPNTDQKTAVDQGLAASTELLSSLLPVDVQFQLIAWLATNYSQVPVGGSQMATFGTMQFTLARSQTDMTLEILPAK